MLLLLSLSHPVGAASFAEKFMPGTPYYFNDFDPKHLPWEPGQPLNFEEVFKNYQYYEIVFGQGGNGITVYRYINGKKESSEEYLIMPDRSLQKQ